MKREDFFEEWKEDWEERKEEFHTNQAELFRHIRDRKNLEIKSSLQIQEKDRGMCSIKSGKS
uniref:Uncharacterized protein n=1 Tax=Candidatus Methanophagaceae archaeon ANME-1 ERB6 TaxID=2759912 RepID=A0A7G9YSB7_9EURY|nr:hypothetical protein LELLBOIK_00016 [Methanosarcinales archaeon ANME-1 ERB6]